jgi:hypothetical protein
MLSHHNNIVKLREKENDINCLLSTGVPKALATINRRPKQETSHMIPDDGYVRQGEFRIDSIEGTYHD